MALALARTEMIPAEGGGQCYDDTVPLELEGRYTGALLPGMADACPYAHVLRCGGEGSARANRTCRHAPF